MTFSLRDFCEPGDEYVDYAAGTREVIPEPTYKVVRHADYGTGTGVVASGLTKDEAESRAAYSRTFYRDNWVDRFTVHPE